MFIVGLTGGISTGKTTVGRMLREQGIPVLDADYYARKVVEPGQKAWKRIKEEFGETVFHEDGQLNREVMGKIIFKDKDERRKLNQITHPEIYKEMAWAAIKCFFKGHPFIVMDLPLLYETGVMLRFLHKVIVVTCEEDVQLKRLIMRNGCSEGEARLKVSAQMSNEEKMKRADFVIYNGGSEESTKEQLTNILCNLKSSRRYFLARLVTMTGFSTLVLISAFTVSHLIFKSRL